VLSADAASKRIALSMKALELPGEQPAPKPRQKPSMQQQLESLNSRFRSR
jgi:predicted RNA-binding protein with RPS1 domain